MSEKELTANLKGGIPAGYVYNRSITEGNITYIYYTSPLVGLDGEGLIFKNYNDASSTNIMVRAYGNWEDRANLNYL